MPMSQPLTPLTTRDELLAHAERLRRAAQLLEAQARRCREPAAPAHAEALRVARGMVRAVVESEAVNNP
jgi:hypothetical protein